MSLTSMQKKETNVVELEIAVDAAALKEATDKAFLKKSKSISVPGFRKGKAPRKVIETMYGEGFFTEDAVNNLYPKAYSDAVDEAGIEPVDKAEVEVLTLDKETGFTFKATVTVKPDVTVKNYKGIQADKTVYTITDADVNAEIDRMRERNARIVSVEDRPAKLGDETVIDFEGFVDDVPFAGGKGEGHSLTLGTHSFIDTFEDQIVGHSVGDEFDVLVNFPEEYHAEELKGKPARFAVKLNEIKGKELPELDDEFAKDVSEFDTVDELKADIRKKQEDAKSKKSQDDFETLLVDEVIKNLEGEIPACMYESRMDDMMQDFSYRIQSQGLNMDMYLQYTGMTKDALRESFREQSERQVKIRLALDKIAQLENISATEEDIAKEYEKIAEMYKVEVDNVKAMIPEKDVMADFKSSKAIDLVRDSAVVNEVVEAAKE